MGVQKYSRNGGGSPSEMKTYEELMDEISRKKPLHEHAGEEDDDDDSRSVHTALESVHGDGADPSAYQDLTGFGVDDSNEAEVAIDA